MTRPDPAIDAYLEGTLTDEQARAIDSWIAADAANAAAFLHLVRTHQMLGLIGKEQSLSRQAAAIKPEQINALTLASLAEMEAAAEPVPFESLDLPFAFEPARKRQTNNETSLLQALDDLRWAAGKAAVRLIRSPYGITGAIAAILLLGVYLFVPLGNNEPTPPEAFTNNAPTKPAESAPPILRDQTVATLTAEHNATWAEGALAPGSQPRTGDTLAAGQRLNLTAGFAEITTNDGAIAILEAPATIELLESDNALRLHSGKLVGLCHTASSKGFAVKTDHGDIVDLGTEFGVEVGPSGVETKVFAGVVEVSTPTSQPQLVKQGQAARLTSVDDNPEFIIEATTAQGYTRRLPRTDSVVTSARINVDGLDPLIVPSGCQEDGLLYADRTHQINGVDASGIPATLLGGDMVLMPADATTYHSNDANNLELQLTVGLPADVYVLIATQDETGGKYGDWLERDYIKTSMVVGQDFSESKPGGGYSLGVGPGVSVEEHLEVWKRKQPINGSATVAGPVQRWMYGVVVVPAQ